MQPTSPVQAGWPSLPQVPPWQPPAVHVPWVELQVPAAATQRLVFWSQHPPPPHWLPSQQGWPAPPQAVQVVFVLHARPDAVQKSAAAPPPAQQAWFWPPHDVQAPPVQVPTPPPQVVPAPTQVAPAQQPPSQELVAQHGWPGAPQLTKAPPTQTAPAALEVPAGAHRPVAESKHAPPAQPVLAHGGWNGPPQVLQVPMEQTSVAPLQVVPPQQGCPRPPQPAHWPVARQRSPRPQAEPVARHTLVPVASQQPVVQLLCAQHGWPTVPQAKHTPARHDVPAPQVSPVQHG